jgi:hypothetical protein
LTTNVDKYGIFAGTKAFRQISHVNDGFRQQDVTAGISGSAPTTTVYTDFGAMQAKLIRWLPTGSILVLRKDFIDVANFNGLSFATREYDNGSLSKTGYVSGTYGLRLRNEQAHAKYDGIA